MRAGAMLRRRAGAVLVVLMATACPGKDGPEWPPRVDAGVVRRVTEDQAAGRPEDGAAVPGVRFGYISGMAWDAPRARLLIVQRDPDQVLAVTRGGRIEVLVDKQTKLPRLPVESLDSDRVSDPTQVGAGPDGTVFFTEDAQRSVVRAVDAKGQTRTVAGGGGRQADPGSVLGPRQTDFDITAGLAVGDDGTVYVSDSGELEPGDRVWAVSPDGQRITKLFGSGGTLGEEIDATLWLAAEANLLWVVPDTGGEPPRELFRVDAKAQRVDTIPRRDRGPSRVVRTAAGRGGVFVADEQGAVWHMGADGRAQQLLTPQQLGSAPASATALAFDGERLYIAGGDTLSVFRPGDLGVNRP